MRFLVGSSNSQPIKTSLMSCMVPMREVESSNTHSAFDKSLELIHSPTSRSESTDDLGVTIGFISLGNDLVKDNV